MSYINGNRVMIARIPTYLDLDTVYPVGSVYISVNSTSPASLFGGTWELINSKFLLGTDDLANLGNTGGEATHVLTIDEMPSHRHGYLRMTSGATFDVNTEPKYWGANVSDNTDYTGGSQAHNNMPPYIKVAIWKRTA